MRYLLVLPTHADLGDYSPDRPYRFSTVECRDQPAALAATVPEGHIGIAVLPSGKAEADGVDHLKSAEAWVDAAGPGPRLETHFRSTRVVFRGGRALVQGSEDMLDAAVSAAVRCSVLLGVFNELEERGDALWNESRDLLGSKRASLPRLRDLARRAAAFRLDMHRFRHVTDRAALPDPADAERRLLNDLTVRLMTLDRLDGLQEGAETIFETIDHELTARTEDRSIRVEYMILAVLLLDLAYLAYEIFF